MDNGRLVSGFQKFFPATLIDIQRFSLGKTKTYYASVGVELGSAPARQICVDPLGPPLAWRGAISAQQRE